MKLRFEKSQNMSGNMDVLSLSTKVQFGVPLAAIKTKGSDQASQQFGDLAGKMPGVQLGACSFV